MLGLFHRWQPLEIGHPTSITKHPPGLEMRGDVLEARDLLILRREIHDRVEDR